MNYLFTFIIFFVLFPLVVLWGIGKRKEEKNTLLTKEDSGFIRGFATIGVFLAHLESYYEEFGMEYVKFLKPFSVLGGIGVLLFFFVSGYGLWKSYSAGLVSKIYWKKRIINVFIPAIVIQGIFAIESMIRLDSVSVSEFLERTFTSGWFVDVIMLEYLLFFIVYCAVDKMGKNNPEARLILLYLLDIILVVVFFILKLDARWYNGLLLFPVGMSMAKHEEYFIVLFKKHPIISVFAGFVGFVFSGMVFYVYKGAVWADAIKTLCGITLSFLFVVVLLKMSIGNRVMKWIGDRSLFFYLIHAGIIEILFRFTRFKTELNLMPYASWILLVSSTIVCWLFYGIFEKIFYGRKKSDVRRS